MSPSRKRTFEKLKLSDAAVEEFFAAVNAAREKIYANHAETYEAQRAARMRIAIRAQEEVERRIEFDRQLAEMNARLFKPSKGLNP